MNKRFLAILTACILVFAGLLMVNKKRAAAPDTTQNGEQSAVTLTQHTVGQGSSGVTLTEYGDFACPACYEYYPLVKAVKEKYGDQIKFQFRHYPLTEIHQNALISARAAEAASKQGKFFEMHDKLYETQPSWRDHDNPAQFFEDYATQLALNVDQFREDMKSDAINRIVQADRGEARRLKYSSTPTFEIDGKKIENPRDIDGFSKLIDEAIKAKSNQ